MIYRYCQAIEFNDQIRKSNYSFELVNNRLRIFPIPSCRYHLHANAGTYVYFEYIFESDRQ